MSRWDEYDRMLERMQQGLEERKDRVHIEPLPEHLDALEKFKNEIQAKVLAGVTEGKTWKLQADGFVKIQNQAFPFKVKLPQGTARKSNVTITRARVRRFLTAHDVNLSDAAVGKITMDLQDSTENQAKAELKRVILQKRTAKS
jgi:hypothetical protein